MVELTIFSHGLYYLQARTQLSRPLREAEPGQEAIVLRGKQPVAKIVPIQPQVPLNPPVSEHPER
jgi:antitoxin (DNA-binding transcriptional repressor) of toxin-antitoxin stability system